MMAPIADHREAWRVALVDDDVSVRKSLSRMISLYGYEVQAFASAQDFLSGFDAWRPDLMLLDLRMPGMDGLALQASLSERGMCIPTVFLSGHGDVTSSVRALRAGAIDFLEKPCEEAELVASLDRAAGIALAERSARDSLRVLGERVATLTRREREVFRWVVTGTLNKQIAAALSTTEKTIKVHRARVMTKMNAHSVVELVRMFDQIGGEVALGQGTARAYSEQET
jgi:FixJ family two-component response regulator